MRQGRFDEAQHQLETALVLDPLSKALTNGLAFLFYYSRDYDRARVACRKTLDLDANYFQAVGCHALICLEQRQFEEAMRYFEQARKLTRDNPIALAYYAYACASLNRVPEAREILAGLLERASTAYTAPAYIGLVYAGLGDVDAAFEWLDKACQVRDSTVTFLGVFQAFDPLRTDPRFAKLLERVGLPANMHPEKLSLAGASVGRVPSIFSETAQRRNWSVLDTRPGDDQKA
jgi:tetratricopeptide (TPR) repeat protein